MIPRSPRSPPAAPEAPPPWVTEPLLDHLRTDPKKAQYEIYCCYFQGQKGRLGLHKAFHDQYQSLIVASPHVTLGWAKKWHLNKLQRLHAATN